MTCWLCGRNGAIDPLDKHHCFTGALRKKAEKYGLYVYLCHNRCHLGYGTGDGNEDWKKAVHKCEETRLSIQRWAQEKAMRENNWSVEDFIRKFGKNYLED